jgi:hypothetical protein
VKNELSVDEIELKITKHQKKYSEERERIKQRQTNFEELNSTHCCIKHDKKTFNNDNNFS